MIRPRIFPESMAALRRAASSFRPAIGGRNVVVLHCPAISCLFVGAGQTRIIFESPRRRDVAIDLARQIGPEDGDVHVRPVA